jgi:hypothetical protein
MSAFSEEQREILNAIVGIPIGYTGSLHAVLTEFGNRLAAIEKVLYDKGLATPQEVKEAEEMVRAAAMVEKALSPEIEEAENRLRQLLEGEKSSEERKE